VVEQTFLFTANQEQAHAKVFYKHLQTLSGETIQIDGTYPVDLDPDVAKLLRMAQHNELEEFDPVYPDFAKVAREEGFNAVAGTFDRIAKIEKTHGERFGLLADLLEQGKLFTSEVSCGWMCLNCGFVFTGTQVPEKCPACDHPRGFFIRLSMAPYTQV
jgi:rubrerythrin